MGWDAEDVLEFEGAELLVDHLPDDLVGRRHYECLEVMLVVEFNLLPKVDVEELFLADRNLENFPAPRDIKADFASYRMKALFPRRPSFHSKYLTI